MCAGEAVFVVPGVLADEGLYGRGRGDTFAGDALVLPDRQYTWGTDLLAQQTATGPEFNTHYPLGDHLGTIRLLTDTTGAPVPASSYRFHPFGTLNQTNTPNEALTNYKFTGQYADANLSLQYHRARWLDTSHANWLSADRVFDWPGNFGNAYEYAAQTPTNALDNVGTFASSAEALAVVSIVGDIISTQICGLAGVFGSSGSDLIQGSDATRMLGLAAFVITMIQIVMVAAIGSAILVGICNYIKGLLRRPGVIQAVRTVRHVNSKGVLVYERSALRFAPEMAEEVPVVGTYDGLEGKVLAGEERNHLNQIAAFGSEIPEGDGVCVVMKGNPIDPSKPGSHSIFHEEMAKFWSQFHAKGPRPLQRPTVMEYNDALESALKASGYTEGQARALRALAEDEQLSYNVSPWDPVPTRALR